MSNETRILYQGGQGVSPSNRSSDSSETADKTRIIAGRSEEERSQCSQQYSAPGASEMSDLTLRSPTTAAYSSPEQRLGPSVTEVPTRVVPRHDDDSDKTRIMRPSGKQGNVAIEDPMADPLAAWLVVVEGPGKGHSLKIGYGMNSVGRGSGQRCRLDFGDGEISRETHMFIIYDPKHRAFYIQHGGGKNLVYLNDAPVLQPTPLKGGELIAVGQTKLRFAPFCGPEFDWETVG